MRIAKLALLLTLLLWLGAGAAAWAQPAGPTETGTIEPAAVEDIGTGPQATGSPTATGTAGAPTGADQPGLPKYWLYFLLGAVVLMWLFMGRGRKKERRRRQQMLESIKKGDKVTTLGGIIGTVLDIKENEVTLKVDESANVRMKFLRRAIHQVGEPPKGEGGQSESK